MVRLRPGLWLGGRRGLGELPSAPRVLQAPSHTLLLWQHPPTKPTPHPLPAPPAPGCPCSAWRATSPLRTKELRCSSITKIGLYLPPAALPSPSSSAHPALCRGVLSPTHPLRGLATRAVAGGDTPDSSPAASARGPLSCSISLNEPWGRGTGRSGVCMHGDDGRCSAARRGPAPAPWPREAAAALGCADTARHRASSGCSAAPSSPHPVEEEENKSVSSFR